MTMTLTLSPRATWSDMSCDTPVYSVRSKNGVYSNIVGHVHIEEKVQVLDELPKDPDGVVKIRTRSGVIGYVNV